MNLADIPRPSLRARVYWLTAAISHLQLPAYDETSGNQNDTAQEGLSAAALFHAHLATLLTRGKSSESTRIIAVTSGTTTSGNEVIQIFSTPDNSPNTSPDISPSTSSNDNTIAPEKPARTTTLIISRNSNPNTIEGSTNVEAIVLPQLSNTLMVLRELVTQQRAQKEDYARVKIPNDFPAFTTQVLEVFGTAAGLQSSEPNQTPAILAAISLYAVLCGTKKLLSLIKAFKGLYHDLREWTPLEEEKGSMPRQEIIILDHFARQFLNNNGINTGSNDKFLFNGSNMAAWWTVLIDMIDAYSVLAIQREHIFVAAYSGALRVLLRSFPGRFWAQESLQSHLVTDRAVAKRAAETAATKRATGGKKVRADGPAAADDKSAVPEHAPANNNAAGNQQDHPANVDDNNASAGSAASHRRADPANIDNDTAGNEQGHPANANADELAYVEEDDNEEDDTAKAIEDESLDVLDPTLAAQSRRHVPRPECWAFVRGVAALSAWTAAASSIANTLLKRQNSTFNVTLVDLPRQAIPDIPVAEITAFWAAQRGWSTSQSLKVSETLGSIKDHVSKGACHAEAGLLASFLRCARPQVSKDKLEDAGAERMGLPVEGYTGSEEPEGHIPDGHEAAFARLFPGGIFPAHQSIGVAKKCCPVCRILVKVTQTRLTTRLELPGQHGSYHPWVPPDWLPTSVLLEVEDRLLNVLEKLMVKPEEYLGSRSSSPASSLGEAPVLWSQALAVESQSLIKSAQKNQQGTS
ncbi:hypothetical protein B0H16DRAFT_1536844 [Mycena metata]|uniref:Uncharacterized protein n=1 Tax=Mycena metata TaxID=1033252 RepID=A0AAD7J703_9AGAR|nr:hypothetical protein B0H16DRAFT_1536844 [Mycena metata]